MNFVLLEFDGELLFHNNCRPFDVIAKFSGFESVDAVLSFIVANRDKEKRAQHVEVELDSSDDSCSYDESEYVDDNTLFGRVAYVCRLKTKMLQAMKSEEEIVQFIKDRMDRSWQACNINAMAIVNSDETLYQIISQHENALVQGTRIPMFQKPIKQ